MTTADPERVESAGGPPFYPEESPPSIDPLDAHERRRSLCFIDVRKAYEWQAGHIEGSRHVTLQEVPASVNAIGRDLPIVVVCQIGQRSALATVFLREHGLEAYNLDGGLEMWARNDLPLVAEKGEQGGVVDGWAEALEW